MSYTTYVTTWISDPLIQIQDMINNLVLQTNIIIILAFASFNFNNFENIPGINNITIEKIKYIIDLVHINGGKINLSIGGATYFFYNSELYKNPIDLANYINQIIINYGFDGVDFDIEDYYLNVPNDFAYQASLLINTLRNLNNNLYITLTTSAQAWIQGCYQLELINLTINSINAWQPMEYNLLIDINSTYYKQIHFDINFYLLNWNIPPNKLILGLMIGYDDNNNNLTLEDVINLTSFGISNNLQGIMTWNANIDSICPGLSFPYSYSLEIQKLLSSSNTISNNIKTIKDDNENNSDSDNVCEIEYEHLCIVS